VPTYAEFTALASSVITDVKVNNTSIVSSNVANIPTASNSNFGVVKTAGWAGVLIENDGTLNIRRSTGVNIKSGTNTNNPITPNE